MYDYNPFGTDQSMLPEPTDADTTTHHQHETSTNATTEQQAPTDNNQQQEQTTNTLQDLRARFPNYAWESDDKHQENELAISWPSTEDPRKFGKVPIKLQTEKGNVNFHVPYDWWEPIVAWFQKLTLSMRC